VPPIVLLVWFLGIAAKGLAAYRIVRKGLFDSLAIFLAFIVFSVARSTALLCFRDDPSRYRYIAADSMPLMLLAEGFAIVSVFWLLTQNFPRWRRPGTIVLVSLCVLGAAAALAIRKLGVPADWSYGWAQAWEGAILLQRHGMTAMIVVLAGCRLLLALVHNVPVCQVARRASDVLCIDVLLGLVNSILTLWLGRRYPLVAFEGPVLAGLVNGLLWAFWLPAAAAAPYLPAWARNDQDIDWKQCASDLFLRITGKPTSR
jgi:hypothetical protein